MNNHGTKIMELPCELIFYLDRHRKDLGDLQGLAESIEKEGLLQPIGVTPEYELVFGERRLCAVRDVLKREMIEVRIVDLPNIAVGEFVENELRKDFSPSERTEIARTLGIKIGDRQGQRTDIELRTNLPEVPPGVQTSDLVVESARLGNRTAYLGDRQEQRTDIELRTNLSEVEPGRRTEEFAAKKAGFGSRTTYLLAKKVVENAVDEIVAQMDSEQLAISSAALIADEPPERQRVIAAMPPAEQREVVRTLRRKDLPSKEKARQQAQQTGKAILDRNLMYQFPVTEEQKPQVEQNYAAMEIIDAITALARCPHPAGAIAAAIKSLDTPDMDFAGRCRTASTYLNQINQEINPDAQQ